VNAYPGQEDQALMSRLGESLKVVYLNTTGELGGAEMCLLDLLAVLRSARPAWRLKVLLGAEGPLVGAVAALGVSHEVLPLPPALNRLGDSAWALASPGRQVAAQLGVAARGVAAAWATAAYLARLRRVLDAETPDRLHTNGMKAHVLGAWAAPRGLPIVWHLHDYIGARPVMARLLRWSARQPLTAVAVSRSVAGDAAKVLGARAPVVAIHNGVDLEQFAPGPGDGARLDQAAGLPPAPPGTVRVGLVATFARWKGHEVFLEAAARVPADRPCRFYLIGGPIYRSGGSQYTFGELRARAEALGLAGRLGFTGFLNDSAWVLRTLDVAVHASTRPEPFGRVIIEAMACGRAVIASPLGGAAELIEDGVSALACLPGDPRALAAVLVRLIDQPELRRQLGAAGRAAAQARFGRDRLAEPWAALYEGPGIHILADPI
jgi:glycosyltransferase involved in cell wall biosynthesis